MSLTKNEGDYGFVCFYNGNRYEVYAKTRDDARKFLITKLKITRKNEYKLSTHLAERPDGSEVVHSTLSL